MHTLPGLLISSVLQLQPRNSSSSSRITPYGIVHMYMPFHQVSIAIKLSSLEVVALTFPAGYPLACYVDHIGT